MAHDGLACCKSLNEIERFVAKAIAEGVSVGTVVPGDIHDLARRPIASHGLTLIGASDANRPNTDLENVIYRRTLI